jgi:hypothetical protein
MSRNIPAVRRWRVRYYMNHTLLADFVVDAINKRFALWAARDEIIARHLDRYLAADKVTVSPMVR